MLRLLALSLVLALFACAVNPQTGRREIILMSEEQEREIDEEVALQVEAQMGLVQDAELAEYVEELGQAVAENALRQDVDYVFNVVEMEEPNAFALPGGHIYVSRGLLVLSNSEAELANVLGHEIGHVTARHAAQRDAQAKVMTVATILGAAAAAAAGELDVAAGIGQFGGVFSSGLLAAYGRDQEREADSIGQDLSAEVGIDPAGMSEFLDTLDRYTRLKLGASRLPSFFDTHPATPERVAETVTRSQVLRWRPDFGIADSRAAYLAKLDGLAIGKPASEGVIRDNRLLHPDLGIRVSFPPGWTLLNEHTRVIAIPKDRNAVAMLELQGPGDDPRAAAAAAAAKEGWHFSKVAKVRVGELPAFRAQTVIQTAAGPANAEITWVSYEGQIYRLTGAAPRVHFAQVQGSLRRFGRSLQPLREQERESIVELRLRVVRARGGESLTDLGRCTANVWTESETAVLNGLPIDRPLQPGELVKIAREERYAPELGTGLGAGVLDVPEGFDCPPAAPTPTRSYDPNRPRSGPPGSPDPAGAANP